jgi:hypothetical protein
MSKKITFIATTPYGWEVHPKPYPASQAIPDWWRDQPPYDISEDNPEGKKLIVKNRAANATFKKCTPMLDALTSGYIIPLFADVQVRQGEEGPILSWKIRGSDVFQLHGISSRQMPAPPGYQQIVFKYLSTWVPKTPPGYSVMVTSPFGYRDLPFQAIPAVIDSDKSTLEIVPPMWIKEGFEGVIEKGTPLVQVTPFKRDSWKSEFDYYQSSEYPTLEDKHFNGTMVGHYIKNHWSKKTYR